MNAGTEEEIVFRTRKADKIFSGLQGGLLLMFVMIAWFVYNDQGFGLGLLLLGIGFLPLALSLAAKNWLKIIIRNDVLVVKLFFILYKTEISQISKIRIGETMWSGLHKYGTATKGLIVFSRFNNDLYITPEDQSRFLRLLQGINPKIEVEKIEF